MDDATILNNFLAERENLRLMTLRRIRLACGVSRNCVAYWLSGKSPLKRAYKVAINVEFNREIFPL